METTEYYKNKFDEGMEYQDFIADQLRKADPCLILSTYVSRRYQNDRGESATGIEIKYDTNMRATGNIYLEIAEKSNKDITTYTPSGIKRKDNAWLYLVGDYSEAYLFSKKQLEMICDDDRHYYQRGIRKVHSKTKTSVGVLIPVEYAKKFLCLYHFTFK